MENKIEEVQDLLDLEFINEGEGFQPDNDNGNNGDPETEEQYNLRLRTEQEEHNNRLFGSKAEPEDLMDIMESQETRKEMY